MDWRTSWNELAAYGPFGVFFITIADTAFLPTAQAVDLLVAAQAAAAPGTAPLLLACAVTGSTIGAMILWGLARSGGGWALRRSVSEERLEQIQAKVRRYDAVALILPAAVPIPFTPMKLFVFMAGALGVSPIRTAVAFAFARTLRYGLLIVLGIWFGERAGPLFSQYAWAIVAVTGGLVAAFFLVRIVLRRRAAPTSDTGAR